MAEQTDYTALLLSTSVLSGVATVVLASFLTFALWKSNASTKSSESKAKDENKDFVVDRTKYPGGEITVYYGTQTGTAESFARNIEREGPKQGFFVHVVDLEDVAAVDDLKQKPTDGVARCIILTATYGEGEAPDNAMAFSQALCEKASTQILFQQGKLDDPIEPECLKGVDFCVFGLGNRQYDHFNAMGKFFDHALERVGANRVLEVAFGDDDDDLESDFENWKDNKFWPMLQSKYLQGASVPNGAADTTATELPDCMYEIEYHAAGTPTQTPALIHSQSKHYFSAVDCPVTTVRELRTAKDPGSTVHVEIDISKASNNLTYETADNLGVLPVNDLSVVESVAQSLQFDLDKVFSLKAAANHEWHGAPFPMPLSVRECLTRYCDLTQAPRRSDLKLLASYAMDPTDKKALQRMASKEGRAEYREKVLDNYVGLVDILKKCPSIQMSLEHFLGICPLLQTRFFTISSSSSTYPQSIHLTVSVTKHTRPDSSVFKGVCSNYLASRRPGVDTVRVYNRPSTFRLPQDTTRPIIMIGPGTGVAPMRALLQEREYQKQQKQTVGRNILYFGCKSAHQDYIYQDEFKSFQQKGVLDDLHVAFSRETPGKKVYVQHLLLDRAKETWKLLQDERAHVYVCGGVKMGQDVLETLNKIICSEANKSHDEAKAYLNGLSSEGRLVQELWA